MVRHLSIALLVATASVPLSTAQMHGSFARGVTRGIGLHHGSRRFARGTFPSSPYFYSDYAPIEPDIFEKDVPSNAGTPAENVPVQVMVVRPASADDSPQRTRLQPLLIERQGDRYVRYGGAQETGGRETSAHPDYAAPAITPSATQKQRNEAPAAELLPVVLVYRDGHREEIADYAIADGVIYVRGNYWQNGYWTKQVPLAALDPQATMQTNQQRGAKFMLPSASNAVIASF